MISKLKRRDFIRTLSLSSLTILPGTKVLAGLINNPDNMIDSNEEYIDYACRIIQYQSLLYLECYFLNVQSDGKNALLPLRWDDNNLTKDDPAKKPRSYMVVRLPQQHIAEEFFSLQTLSDQHGKKVFAQTTISGYSFLVFEFQGRIELTPQSLLNWNSPRFTLIVKEDQSQSLFEIKRNQIDRTNIDPAGGSHPYLNEYPLGYYNSQFKRNGYPKYTYGKFDNPQSANSLKFTDEYISTDRYLLNDPGPATAIEAPYRLILSPQLPDPDVYEFFWSFSFPPVRVKDLVEAELWTAKLQVRKKINPKLLNIPKDPKAELNKNQRNEGDNQIKLMMIGSPDDGTGFYDQYCPADVAGKKPFPKLPCAMDRKDLTYLYLHAQLKARTQSLTFSPLGISTYINFRNSTYNKNQNSLYQWNQQISYGRDQQVTVSRIWVDAIHGCKMLHIQSTNRETYNEQSVLIYREFLMPLDCEKDFSLYDNDSNINNYKDPSYKFNSCFKRAQFQDCKPIEIRPINELTPDHVVTAAQSPDEQRQDCDCSNQIKGQRIVAFKPVTLDGKDLEWEMLLHDWHQEDEIVSSTGQNSLTGGQAPKGKPYSISLPFLSSDLAKDPAYEMNADLLKDIDKAFVLNNNDTFPAAKTALESNVKNLARNVWSQIFYKTEDFELRKTDLYRAYLENKINSVEQKLKDRAQDIADQVIEEWNAFKRRALNSERDILSVVSRLSIQINKLLDVGTAEGELKTQFNDIKSIIDSLSGEKKEEYKNLHEISEAELNNLQDYFKEASNALNAKVASIARDIETDIQSAISKISIYKREIIIIGNSLLDKILNQTLSKPVPFKKIYSSFQNKIAVLQNYLNAIAEVEDNADSLGFEYAYQLFLSQLPKGFTDSIQDVKNDIADLKNCFHELQHTEENLLCKANVYKAKVGYAVSYVEEELGELKKKLQDKWEKLGQFNNWEAEYNDLRKKYHEEVNKPLSALQTEYVIFRNNYRHYDQVFQNEKKKMFDFYHENSCFPQLHTAKVFVQHVSDLVHRDIPMRIKYAEDYYKNQVNNLVLETKNNAARIFAEIKADAKELIKGAVKEIGKEMGGLVNPELAADFLTYAKDIQENADAAKQLLADTKQVLQQSADSLKNEVDGALHQKIQDIINAKDGITTAVRTFTDTALNEYKDQLSQAKNSLVLLSNKAKHALLVKENEAKAYLEQLEAKILGAIHLKDIIGDTSMLPRLDRKNDKITYTFVTKQLISPPRNSIFSFTPRDNASLILHFEKPLKNMSQYVAWTRLNNFDVGIFDERIKISFDQLQIYSDNTVKNKVSVHIREVHFFKELAFIEKLSNNIKLPGTGLSLSIHPTDVSVDFSYQLPGISGGAFNFFNVKFHVGVTIPFPIGVGNSVRPIVAKFGINGPDDKFVLGVGIWGGKGHAILETTPKYVSKVDVGMDYGGLLALNLGIAQGQAFLMAGIRYVYRRDDLGRAAIELYAIVTCGGSVTVFGFITISVVFLLGLKYESYAGKSSLYGIASVTYSVEIGFFKKSFTLSFSKRLYGSDSNASSGEGYGYIPDKQRPAMNDYVLSDAVWRDSDQEMIRRVKNNDQEKKIQDEYTYGQQQLEERYTQEEWRRICRIYKF